MICLFCGDLEKNYKPDPEKDFICSRCVQIMTSADQAELKRAYNKAIKKDYPNKVRAIESFLIPEGFDEQRKPISKKRRRYTNRKGTVGTFGDKEKRIGRSKVSAPTSVL